MHPTPKSSAKSKRTPGSDKKKQKTILSFFSKTASAKSSPFSKPTLASTNQSSPQITPTTTVPPSEKPERTTARKTRSALRGADAAKLKRELFSENDPDPSAHRVKRRKILLDDDDDDDLSDDDEPALQPRTNMFSAEPPSRAHKSARVDDDNQSKSDVDMEDDYQPPKNEQGDDSEASAGEDEQARDEEKSPPERIVQQNGTSFDFSLVTCHDRTSGKPPPQPVPLTKQRKHAREKLAGLADVNNAVGSEQGGWCERHPWSINIRDAKKRLPSDPDYDKSTLYVPPSELHETSRYSNKGGLSPFQRQFWSIKKDNYDIVIFFKKGKFYELYDIDADIGHKHLRLNFTKGGRVDMRCCGVPEMSFEKHCSRLIEFGFKVGKVEQTETANAAEKRKRGGGSNKSAVCERTLVRILTKGTVTDEKLLRDHRARYVLAIAERDEDLTLPESNASTVVADEAASQAELTRTLGICYVDVASGSINIGELRDDFRLSKTERLVTFLRPQEIVVDLSKSSERVANIVKWTSNKSGTDVIDTACKNGLTMMTDEWLAKYLSNASSSPEHKKEYARVCSYLQEFPLGCRAFGGMAAHLRSLIIDKETLSLGNYNLFSASSDSNNDSEGANSGLPKQSSKRLRMDAPTFQNLEILSSNVDNSELGALISFVDRAHTPAGRRLMRKWISEPLVCSEQIEDRLQAIEDIHRLEDEDGGRTIKEILKQLKTKKDLERALPKLHQQATVNDSAVMFDDSNKRRVKDFVAVLRSLENSLVALENLHEALDGVGAKSQHLIFICSLGGGVPTDSAEKLQYFLGEAFDLAKAEDEGEIVPKTGAVPLYDEHHQASAAIEAKFDKELKYWQQELRDRSIKFYHRGREPYQLEIKVNTLKGKNVPSDFELASESKVVKRFYTPTTKKLVRKHTEATEAFEEACRGVARDMMRQFDNEYQTWSSISRACAEVDALMGLAAASRDEGSGPMCRPKILPNSHAAPILCATSLRHPILAAKSSSFVSNDVKLGDGKAEIMILTGPNAGGKSTLARQIALGVILAQLGCYVPAESFTLRPFDDIFVRMGASDDLARGRSTFMVEMEEVGNILNNANERSLVIADEVGRGTSTHDGYAVAYASLDHIARVNRSITVFSTHYSHLGEDIVSLGNKGRLAAALYEMGAIVDEKTKKITFLYKLHAGCSGDSRGIYCARVAGIPESIAQDAEKAATTFDQSLAARLTANKFCRILRGLEEADDEAARVLTEVLK